MLKTSVKNHFKTIIRDPVTVIAFLAGLIMMYIDGVKGYYAVDQLDMDLLGFGDYDYVMNLVIDSIDKPITEIGFPFLAIVIAAHIFKDRRTEMSDILLASKIPFRTYYWSRIISYYLVGLAMCLCMTVSFELAYVLINSPLPFEVDWIWILISHIVMQIVLYIACLPIPIAFAVFLSSLTGKTWIGVVFNCVYGFLPWTFSWYFSSRFYLYAHVTPLKLIVYLKYWCLHLDDPFDSHIMDIDNPLFGPYMSNFDQALHSFVCLALLSAVFLTFSYVLLKRRFQKCL